MGESVWKTIFAFGHRFHRVPCARACSSEQTSCRMCAAMHILITHMILLLLLLLLACIIDYLYGFSWKFLQFSVRFTYFVWLCMAPCATLGALVVHTVVVTRTRTRSGVQVKCLFSKRQQCNKNFSLAATQLFYVLACHFLPCV